MESKIEIYQSYDGNAVVEVKFEKETVWLNRNQLSVLFGRDVKTIGKHINNIFTEGELEKKSVVSKFATTATDGKTYQVDFYNLDVIISVGYRVNSKQGTQFRIWATKQLKNLLLEGYAIHQKRLEQKNQEVKILKDGIRILTRTIAQQIKSPEGDNQWIETFSKGLKLLDDYDYETLDSKGKTIKEALYPSYKEYMNLIKEMVIKFGTGVFAQPKDKSFQSSINQIKQSFSGVDVYLSIEEKAANLLYFIVKNHSFVDGNKRIAAACFLLFLKKNNLLQIEDSPIISSNTLASLTLYIANSQPKEADTVKKMIISVLNRF